MGERQDEPVLSIWQAKQREWEAAEAGWHEGKSGGRQPAHEVSGAAGPKVSAEADMRIFDVPWITQEVWEDDTAAPGSVEPDGHVIPEQRSHGGQRVQGVLQGHAGRRLHRAAGWLAFTLVLLAVGYLAGALGSGLSMTPDNGVSGQAAGGAKKTGSHALNSDSGNQIIIDVHGDVKRPGVYTLPSGSRVGDAVRAAGGYRHAADQAVVNAAELLDDGEEVVIPDAHSHQGSSGIAGSSTQAANSPGAPASGAEPAAGEQPAGVSNKTSAAAGGGSADVAKVDLNTADVATLETLPGVGPARAADIVQYRQEHGPFASVDDLDSVPGIGPATLARLKPYLYVSANPDRG